MSSCNFPFLPQTLFVLSGFLCATPIVAALTVNAVERVLLRWGSAGDDESMVRVIGGDWCWEERVCV